MIRSGITALSIILGSQATWARESYTDIVCGSEDGVIALGEALKRKRLLDTDATVIERHEPYCEERTIQHEDIESLTPRFDYKVRGRDGTVFQLTQKNGDKLYFWRPNLRINGGNAMENSLEH